MRQQSQIDRFKVMEIALEVANDVVAFDDHCVLLELDRRRGEPRATWHYEAGISYAGAEYEREVQRFPKLLKAFRSNRDAQRVGLLKRRKRLYVVKMVYDRHIKGILVVGRDSPDEFSATDVRLLKSVGSLAAAAMCESQAFHLLGRLHIHFLDRRTSMLQTRDVRSLGEQYLEKTEYIFHPEVLEFAISGPLPAIKVRSSMKLVSENGMVLYIVASRSTTARKKAAEDWSARRLATRYDADGKSTITARVFASQLPYLTNEYQSLKVPVKRLFSDVESHMSAPIIAGIDQPLGVLSLETTLKADYSPVHLDALTLLAGHAARPLGRARDRELSAGRLDDLDVTRAMMSSLQECSSWSKAESVLSQGLQRLRYRRGLICEVLYDKRLVVGSHYWGPNMRDLCRKTRRHFIRNKNDCQIKALTKKEPQVISNPKQDPAAHREAVRIAALGPFAIIPVLNRRGNVVWTLHVEREDTAPLGIPEIADLQQICRAAMAVRERLEDSARQQKTADIAIRWAQRLQKRLSQQSVVLENLAEFAVKHVCKRCRVYKFSGNYAIGVCRAGMKLTHVKKFSKFRFSSNFSSVESFFCRNPGPTIVRSRIRQVEPKLGRKFRVDRFGSKFHDKATEKENVRELVQVPLFIHGKLTNVMMFDKYGEYQSLEQGAFAEPEVQLLGTLARLTSLALERTYLEQQAFQQASVGASMGVFRHEIAGCINRLSTTATLYRDRRIPHTSVIHELLATIDRETDRMQGLRDFFTHEVLKQKVKGSQYTTVAHEVKSAIELLGLTHSDLVYISTKNTGVKVPRPQRPLCLILLELLANARKATKSKERPWIKIFLKKGRGCQPHILNVSDNGVGIGEAAARRFQSERFAEWGPREHGLGLWCAQLLAEGQGWNLRLARRKNPTCFQVRIPTKS